MTTDQTNLAAPDLAQIGPTRFEQAVEVTVFLFLIGPSMVLSLFTIRQGHLAFPLVATVTICRDLSLVFLILYLIWRNGEPLASIGWTSRRLVRELMLGVLLFVPLCIAAALLELGLRHIGLSAPKTFPNFLEIEGRGEAILAVVLVTIVAVSEETIFRGYLLLRFPPVLRSKTAAVLLSSAIFASGHGYEGSAGVVSVGFLGLSFALVYLWRWSLIAPIVMHFLQDFLSIVLVPLLGLSKEALVP